MCVPRTRRLRVKQRPVCPTHHVVMLSYASRDRLTYYRCEVDGCRESRKMVDVFIERDELDSDSVLQK